MCHIIDTLKQGIKKIKKSAIYSAIFKLLELLTPPKGKEKKRRKEQGEKPREVCAETKGEEQH